MNETDDVELWTDARGGDSRAFAALYDRYRDPVFERALPQVNSRRDAEDVTALVFLEAWRLRETVRLIDGSVLGWLLATTDVVANDLRRLRRRHRASLARLQQIPVATGGDADGGRRGSVRALLVAVVEGAPAAAQRRRQSRIAVAVVAVAALGGLGAGGAALALSGVDLFGGQPPATTAPAPSATPSPSVTPSPTPTAAPNPTSAPVRVPLSCDELLPQATAEEIAASPMVPGGPAVPSALAFADERVGSLICDWSGAAQPGDDTPAPTVQLTIVPEVSEDAYRATADGIDLGPYPPVPGFGDDSRELCTASYCTLIDHINGYGVRLDIVRDISGDAGDVVTDSARSLFASIADAVTAADAPGPLWRPAGADLAGVGDCEQLVPLAQVAAILGDPGAYVYRAYEGEFAIATFRSNSQVGGYGCAWSAQPDLTVSASVLPGGAPYFERSAPMAGGEWLPADGYPGEAYKSLDGTEVSVLVDDAWFRVGASEGAAEYLPELVPAIVASVQAFG